MTTETIQAAIDANTSRQAELATRKKKLLADIDAAREARGQAAAAGNAAAEKAAHALFRDANDEIDGIESGLEILTQEKAKLEADLKGATLSEAKENRDSALLEWGKLVDSAQAELSELFNNELAGKYAAIIAASRKVFESERTMERGGERVITPSLHYPHRHSQSGGRAVPLLQALGANARGEDFHAAWGGGSAPVSQNRGDDPEWFKRATATEVTPSEAKATAPADLRAAVTKLQVPVATAPTR